VCWKLSLYRNIHSLTDYAVYLEKLTFAQLLDFMLHVLYIICDFIYKNQFLRFFFMP